MSRETGRRLSAIEHLQQSVGDILSTPIGSRVMRRTYGSLVPALIDQPDNMATQIRVYSAIASALMRWEPRLSLEKIATTRDPQRPGAVQIELTGRYVGTFGRDAAPITLSIPIVGKGFA